MDLYIENEQNKIDFTKEHEALAKKVIEAVLENENFKEECEVSLLITDNDAICEMNTEFRSKPTPTDVLSFPMLEFDDEGNIISGDDELYDTLLLGDIVISLERAQSQAEEYGHSLEREIGFLCAHSTLHLLGYDHEYSEQSRLTMRHKEEAALSKIGLTR